MELNGNRRNRIRSAETWIAVTCKALASTGLGLKIKKLTPITTTMRTRRARQISKTMDVCPRVAQVQRFSILLRLLYPEYEFRCPGVTQLARIDELNVHERRDSVFA